MERITEKQLQAVVDRINRVTGSPMAPYAWELDAPLSGPALPVDNRPRSMKAQVGNYHLSHAYGGVCLVRMSNTSGGVSTPIGMGHVPKRELYELMHAFIRGIETGRGN